jgi:hypothetical protein
MSGLSSTGEYSDVMQDGYVSGPVTVSTSAIEAKVGGSRLTNREALTITNQGPGSIWFGPAGVTTSTGDELKKDQSVSLPIGDIGVFMIKNSGSATVIVQEFA